jgi:hypothetical protein
VELAAKFDVPLSQFILGFQGSLLVTVSFGSLNFNALAVKIGNRPIYLFTTIVLMVTCFSDLVETPNRNSTPFLY